MHRLESLSIVTPFYPPHIGGIERYTRQFARAAVDLGLAVNVVTTGDVRSPTVSQDGSVEMLIIPARQIPMSGATFPVPTGSKALWRRFLETDIVISQTRFFLTTLWAARMSERRIHIIDHGAGPLRSSAFGTISMIYERAITTRIKRYAPYFYGVSSASVEWLRTFGIESEGIVPNGVEPCGTPTRGTARNVVFYAGRLLPDKGVLELVEAVKTIGNIELRIAGPGPLRERVAADPAVTYLGVLSPDEIRSELLGATVTVNPSNLREGAPSILLEAACAACPVISTPADIIQDGETGWLLTHGEPGAIAAALHQVLDSKAEAQRRGFALFNLVQAKYTWPAIVRRFLDRAW